MRNRKKYQQTLRQYHWMYVIALTVIALLSLCCQLLIQNYLTNQKSDAHLINYAAKLRSDSQTLVKYALLLERGAGLAEFRTNRKDFKNTLEQWRSTHYSLRNGNEFLNIPRNGNQEIEELFVIIDGTFHDMVSACNSIYLVTAPEADPKLVALYVDQLLKHEKSYLLGMEMIVFDYDLISKKNIAFLKRMEWALFAVLIICLLIEAFVIFIPLYRKLSASFEGLLDNSRASREMAGRLQKIRSESMLAGETRERKRIAAEIHDGIGQMLTALKMKIELLENRESQGNKVMLSEIREITVSIVKETRKICTELLPSVLDDFGLKSALGDLCKTIRSTTSITVDLQDDMEEGVLTKQQDVILYRILQEAVNNVIKHSRAEYIWIHLESDAEMVYIRVSDDGIGFKVDLDKIYEGRHSGLHGYGLVNMKERTEMLGGHFQLSSAPGKGTILELEIPLSI